MTIKITLFYKKKIMMKIVQNNISFNKAANYLHSVEQFQKRKKLIGPKCEIPKIPQ